MCLMESRREEPKTSLRVYFPKKFDSIHPVIARRLLGHENEVSLDLFCRREPLLISILSAAARQKDQQLKQVGWIDLRSMALPKRRTNGTREKSNHRRVCMKSTKPSTDWIAICVYGFLFSGFFSIVYGVIELFSKSPFGAE